jgi:hypothetical protein
MGGAVGFKGADGGEILEMAIILGVKPVAPSRAETFLTESRPIWREVRPVVGAGEMGEGEARNRGFASTVMGESEEDTTAEDTE